MNPGDRVRFKAHGETGPMMTVVTRDGDDLGLCYPNGRLLADVPIELLVLVPKDVAGSNPAAVSTGASCDAGDGERGLEPSQVDRREEQPPSKCWREVDELEAQ